MGKDENVSLETLEKICEDFQCDMKILLNIKKEHIQMKANHDTVNKDDFYNLERFSIENRRYIGSKYKISKWIKEIIKNNTQGETFFDVFAGTGIISKEMLEDYENLIINDFLYSNNIIYKAFFDSIDYDDTVLNRKCTEYNSIISREYDDNYFVENFGNKFFGNKDAMIIGEIRERIAIDKELNDAEKNILIASLLYSLDKVSNTVGHYEAYRKNVELHDKFSFKLIKPINTEGKNIKIYREDANQLVKRVRTDIAFIDPPYNSRQYSRFYHLLESVSKWDKPKLEGVAMKPKPENMSEYCRNNAPYAFNDLITNLDAKYIIVTYNNTYNSKSSSSENKISHEQILKTLNSVGTTKVFEKKHKFFNAGKTYLNNHKEFAFVTEVLNG